MRRQKPRKLPKQPTPKKANNQSLDIDVAAIRCDYTNVQAAGAIMYDHTLFLEAPTAAQFVALQEATST